MWVLMAASTVGLGAVLAASASAFQMVKWCGVLYLAWLGIKVWRAPSVIGGMASGRPSGVPDHRRLALQAFGVGLSNPKAIIFFTALFPQFIDPSRPFLPQILALAATFTGIEFCMIMSTASGAGSLAPWLARGDRARWINRVSGGVLVAAAALLASVRRV
jgi:threonine/homoserine/homoserine lactone efflux protein